MTEQATQDAAVQVTGMVLDKLDQYMMAATEVITKYGGDAVDLGLNVLRIEAAGNLITPFIELVFAIILLVKVGSPKMYKWAKQKDPKYQHPWIMIPIIADAFVVIIIFSSFSNLSNIWNWVGLFWPEAYAVHKFLL